jgi:hypothetical protein
MARKRIRKRANKVSQVGAKRGVGKRAGRGIVR